MLYFINLETNTAAEQPSNCLGAYRELIVQLSQRIQQLTSSSDALLNSFAPSSALDQKILFLHLLESQLSQADAKMEKGLKLGHWQKNNDKSTDYAFARFNKKVKVLSYDDDEYTKHLAHPAWEKAESDLLFELCRRFDLRWPVIHDRFPKGSTPRTMEQLKE